MKYAVISASRVKDKSILALEAEYLKRLRCCEVIDSVGARNCKNSEEEGHFLLKAADKYDRIICLDERGKQQNSKAFSVLLNSWRNKGSASFAFLIGGAYGLSEEVRNKSDFIWSLSELTFPFQIARLLTIEQLYRATCIINGHPYHKE